MSSVKLQALAAAQDRGARVAQADPLPARRPLTLGSKQYEIISEKKGPNAIIHRAYDTEGNREVAIKELDLARIKEKKVFELATREAGLLQSIDHPNVVKCLGYHSDETNDKFFIITEWVKGKTLREEFEARAARGGVSDEEAKGITSKLLEVISQLPVIHRDISPENVMICEDGSIKLVDFGFSLSEHSTGTTYFAIHSLGFTAPEIIQGFRGDKRSDLFSAGAIYFWMKTGMDTMDIRDMGTFDYRLPEGLPAPDRAFLEKAIAFAPDSRFQSAEEMKAALLGVKAIEAKSHELEISEIERKIALVRGLPNFERVGAFMCGTLGGAMGAAFFTVATHCNLFFVFAGTIGCAGLGVGLSGLLQYLSGRKALRELETELADKRREIAAVQISPNILLPAITQEADWSKLDLNDIGILVPYDKGANLFDTISLAERKGYVIVPNEVHHRFTHKIQAQDIVYCVRTGTLVITAGAGKKLPTKITYSDLEFDVPKRYVGQEITLAVNHPHFRIKGNRFVADPVHIHPYDLPPSYSTEEKFGPNAAWLGLLVSEGRYHVHYYANFVFGAAGIKREVYDRLPLKSG